MTTPFICLFVTIFLPYICAGISSFYRLKLPQGIDNKAPRQQATLLEGAGARAYAAQQNAWEALPVFTAAVVTAHIMGADLQKSALAAIIFTVARILHIPAYISNQDKLRSLSFVTGFGCCIWLFILAFKA